MVCSIALILCRILKHLGCPHGCGEGFRGNQAETVRSTTYQTLSLLHRINIKQFRLYLRMFIAKRSLSDILDFFHAFVGFCHDPSVVSISPMTIPRKDHLTLLHYSCHTELHFKKCFIFRPETYERVQSSHFSE